jgi:hypothetical protein
VGRESTGWAVELDSAISVDSKQVGSIELEGLTKKAQKLQDKHVEVVGKLSHRLRFPSPENCDLVGHCKT